MIKKTSTIFLILLILFLNNCQSPTTVAFEEQVRKLAKSILSEKGLKATVKNWNKAIESTMLKMTAVLTLWLLFDKVVPQ